jgi:hypothetical protein
VIEAKIFFFNSAQSLGSKGIKSEPAAPAAVPVAVDVEVVPVVAYVVEPVFVVPAVVVLVGSVVVMG